MARKLKDYEGLKFNYLTAKSFQFIKENQTQWLFNCECGKECIRSISKVKSGKTKSCGCKNLTGKYIRKDSEKIHLEASFKILYHRYKTTSKTRGIFFDIDKESFKTITSLNCHYCGIQPLQKTKCSSLNLKRPDYLYNGIDRIDNNKGYIESNIVPCCFVCNRAKRDMEYLDFLSYIERLKEYKINNNLK